MTQPDDVLAELKSIGALGRPKTSVATAQVHEVAVEAAPPEVPLVDQRGEEMVTLLTEAIGALREFQEGLEALGRLEDHLRAIRRLWTVEDFEEEALGGPQVALVRPEQLTAAREPVAAPEPVSGASEPQEVDEEERQRLLEAVRRKIRGEDLTPDQRVQAWADEDAQAIPVGMSRAVMESDEESFVGTMGTIKPSFPEE